MTRICIAIPTFRRIGYLPGLLDALSRLLIPDDCEITVLIADNDPAAGARATINAARGAFPFPLAYELVTEPGLSTVRNFFLAYARTHADLLAMLDDDEVPEPQWLCEAVRIAKKTGASAVMGPVFPVLPRDAPCWVRDFREREYPCFPDGTPLGDGWTSNCLLEVSSISSFELAFDPALNFIGGEDQLFFRQLLARGGSLVYAAGATVWEILPPARRSTAFILKRSFRRGNSLAICDLRLNRTARGLATRAAKGVAVIALGLVRIFPMTLLGGRPAAIKNSSEIARGAGMLAGLLGHSYRAYRRGA